MTSCHLADLSSQRKNTKETEKTDSRGDTPRNLEEAFELSYTIDHKRPSGKKFSSSFSFIIACAVLSTAGATAASADDDGDDEV